mmetsp:Transcript_26521/g.80441  ORF Transcript_26521/g.80441 Transcript_26521/m.80441 type:complete len:81 (+) Transcript_26521:1483-1725(+)
MMNTADLHVVSLPLRSNIHGFTAPTFYGRQQRIFNYIISHPQQSMTTRLHSFDLCSRNLYRCSMRSLPMWMALISRLVYL